MRASARFAPPPGAAYRVVSSSELVLPGSQLAAAGANDRIAAADDRLASAGAAQVSDVTGSVCADVGHMESEAEGTGPHAAMIRMATGH